jgi:predicted nucleic acid-binding protein
VNRAVLVDTSVWIDHFRARDNAAVAELSTWLGEEPDRIVVNEVVLTELLRGARSEADAATLSATLNHLVQADPIVRADWMASARIYRTCRQAGLTIRSPMDCLIAAHAIRLEAPVLAIDRDFEAIASCTPLRLHRPVARQKPDPA